LLIDSGIWTGGNNEPTYDLDGVGPHSWELAIIDVAPGQQLLHADFGWRIASSNLSECAIDDFEDGQLPVGGTFQRWFLTDFGDADQVSYDESGGVLSLSSDGSSLYAGTDHGAYLFQEVEGNFRVEVDIDGTDMLAGGAYRKGGLMVRPGFGNDEPRLIAQLVPYWNNGSDAAIQARYRIAEGAPGDGAWTSNLFGVPRNVRLAIERVGDTFTVEHSFDGGATWQQAAGGAGGSIDLDWPTVVMVGLNVVSYDSSTASTMVFDNFEACLMP
ncbi:MAG: hypothetical protein MI919_02320, partial [Holophagales bacterium]|nr:hypothetical protein [Holophagales bacterium]